MPKNFSRVYPENGLGHWGDKVVVDFAKVGLVSLLGYQVEAPLGSESGFPEVHGLRKVSSGTSAKHHSIDGFTCNLCIGLIAMLLIHILNIPPFNGLSHTQIAE